MNNAASTLHSPEDGDRPPASQNVGATLTTQDLAPTPALPLSHARATTTDMASEEDQRLHNVGVTALAAIAQYPHAVNEESNSLLVSEVVHAMTGRSMPLYHHHNSPSTLGDQVHPPLNSGNQFSPLPFSPPSDGEGVTSRSNALSPLSQDEIDIDMEGIVQDLIERTATWPNIATIVNESDPEKDLVMDYDPEFEDHTSPSTTPDDEFEDFLRFYPDEEEYYRDENESWSPEAAMHDVDLDEFYHTINYDTQDVDIPQVPGTPAMGPFPGVDELDAHPPSIIHTTTHERNLTIDEFIQRWVLQTNIIPQGFHSEHRIPPQLRPLSKMMSWTPPRDVYRPHKYEDDIYDLQQIPWMKTLKVKHSEARALRDAWYTSYQDRKSVV